MAKQKWVFDSSNSSRGLANISVDELKQVHEELGLKVKIKIIPDPDLPGWFNVYYQTKK